MAGIAISTSGLTVYYGQQRGIIDVDLTVHAGEVFGFLGPNGAGKTTTQRILLDVIRPTAGRARIFGLDCQRDGDEVRARVGYLPGDLSLYRDMRADSLLNLMGSLYGGRSDSSYRAELCERLGLDPTRRIKEYSRGNRQKVGVVLAFMNRPDLLILDEPTSGLDPLVQQTVLDLVREACAADRTVFFTSHNLPEVQAVCDRVGIIREGRLVKTERVETLMAQQFVRLKLSFQQAPDVAALALEGVEVMEQRERGVTLEVRDNLQALMRKAAGFGIVDIETLPVTLEEIFLAYYGQPNDGRDNAESAAA